MKIKNIQDLLFVLFRKYFSKCFAILLLLCLICSTVNSNAQSTEKEKSVVAYIYNISNHIEWENEKNLKEFTIVVLSDNKTLRKELEKLAEIALIKEKPITLIFNKKDINNVSVQIVFIAEDKIAEYEGMIKKTNGYPILVITQNFPNRNIIMLNLYDSRNNKIRFEINRDVISKRKIKIDNELLLQESINQMDRNSDSLDIEITRQKKSIAEHDSILQAKDQQMSIKDSQLRENLIEIAKQIMLIDEQKKTLVDQRNAILIKEKRIRESDNLLQKKGQEVTVLSNQQKQVVYELRNGDQKLKIQQRKMSLMDSIISQKTIVLSEQKSVISRQKKSMQLSYAIIILSVLIIIIILNTVILFKKKNKILKTQKTEIEQGNIVLQETNEELLATNSRLYETLDQLKETQAQLIQSEKMASLGVLTAGIAHELNNPINFVYAGVNSMKKDFKDIEPILESIKAIENNDSLQIDIKALKELFIQNEFDEAFHSLKQTIADISLGAERSADIIKSLSRFSRIEKEEWEMFDIHESIENVLLLLKNRYKYHVEIIKEFNLQIPLVECHSGKINQVLMNIMSNAIDAIKDKGEIQITTSLNDNKNSISISIKDNGEGISTEVKDKIFDPFFTTKKVGKGVGLGLSISYGIVKEHKGIIYCNSEKGIGTEFIIELPINQS
jgi:signal transduction histidine kinase